MELKTFIKANKELEKEIIKHRHNLHKIPEVGTHLPLTQKYILDTLQSYGLNPKVLKHESIVLEIGKGEVIIFRCDIDALPIKEENKLEYKSINDNMHACGHDLHAAIMLGVCKILKENESSLKNTIRIIFEVHEEGLVGALEMIEDGALENATRAYSLHNIPNSIEEVGTIVVSKGVVTLASTIFEIIIHGKATHGATPQNGIDALRAAVKLYDALENIIAHEVDMNHSNVLTIGILESGKMHNIIPDKAYMRASLRSYNEEDHEYLFNRIKEVTKNINDMYHTSYELNILQRVNSVVNDESLVDALVDKQEDFNGYLKLKDKKLSFSEDFARLSKEIPSVFVTLASNNKEYALHDKNVIFDDKCLIYGVYYFYNIALK